MRTLSPFRVRRVPLWTRWILALVLIGGGVAIQWSLAEERPDAAADIRAVLEAQAQAWNRGDIDQFMKTYWNSDDLTFSSGGKTQRGWSATRDNYKERYPTPERMGRVSFDELEVTLLGDTAAMVLGRWKLDRNPDPLGGNFTLVLRKIDGQWLIIHDHTSRGE